MRELIKRSGIIFIIAGVVLIAYYEMAKLISNNLLILSGSLIFFGFILYLLLNNLLE